jgi:hypothetical protein
MERTDWLDEGLDSVQARFLMLTAITHHRFSSPLWGGDEIHKLHEELAELDVVAARVVTAHATAQALENLRRGHGFAQQRPSNTAA